MSRTVGDIPVGMGFPAKGKHNCIVTDAIKGKSKKKFTPQITLTLSNGETEFTDDLFVTEKTLRRLCLVAKRVCGMPDDFPLPDGDLDASNEVAKYIMANVINKECIITIEENEESFIPTSGPDMGRPVKVMRKRVAFNGYEKFVEQEEPHTATNGSTEANDKYLPF